MLEFSSGGRRVSQKEFFENLERQAIDAAMKQLEEKIYAAASSIIDPETGKHAEVFITRPDDTHILLRTRGSPAFARELEKRLDLSEGSITTGASDSSNEQAMPDNTPPRLYLAHASEDHHTLARPLAEKLMAAGIQVWFDEWEIRAGDSLRRKMEEGLASCTHFLVLLTPHSLNKPWVQTEIDAGFIRGVGGESRFIGVRVGLGVDQLSPFLRTLRCPEIRLESGDEVAGLIADIHDVSRKPPLGTPPKYVRAVPDGLGSWSKSAIAVAEFVARKSEHGRAIDPQLDFASVADATGLSEEDVRLGVLDLKEAGLVKSSETIGRNSFWPLAPFFVEFDKHFLGFDNKADAVAIATYLINQKFDGADAQHIAGQFPDWPVRRLNGALNYLAERRLVQSVKGFDGLPYALTALHINDRTRRFVRENA